MCMDFLCTDFKVIAMKRPVLWALGFFICGIILGAFGSLPLFGLAVLAGLFLCTLLFRVYKYWPVFVFMAFLLIGYVRAGHSLHSYITEPVHVQLSGVAQDVGVTGGGNQRVIVRTADGLQIIAYIRPHLPWAALGQQITVAGELTPLTGPRNPGGYNQFQHLRSQKVDSVMWPESVRLGDTRLSLIVMLRMARDRLAAVYEQILPPREAAVIKSMILGDRYEMDRDLAAQYRMMGIFHILSISGLHVAILMMAFNKVLTIFVDERRAGLVVLVVMVLYCLMTGASPATVRAVTMGGVLVFGKVLGRGYDLLVAVSWACIALLMYEPLFLFNVGFQLSFVAVYGIAVLTKPVERLLAIAHVPQGTFRSGLAVNIAAVCATYPVFAFHMYEIQLYSIAGNMIIAPTTTIILVLGLVTGLTGLVALPAATFMAGTVYYILRFYDVASGFFARLPFAMTPTSGGNLIIAGLGAAVLLLFAYTFNGYGDEFRRRLKFLPIAAAVLIFAVFIRHNPPGKHITELDTFGGYTVIRHRNDVLVTGAPHGGEDALLRYLDMHGVSRASGLILTELPRPRDANRLARLAERFDVFYISGDAIGTSASLAMAAIGELEHPPEIVRLHNGDVRAAGRKQTQIFTGPDGGIRVRVKFGDGEYFWIP